MKKMKALAIVTGMVATMISAVVIAPASHAASTVICAPTSIGGRAATKLDEPKWAKTAANYNLNLVTNCGIITIAVDAKHAPITAQAFKLFATNKYFDNTKCHRIVTSGIFILQCGDPTATGSGGPVDTKGAKWPGYADENLPTQSRVKDTVGKVISSAKQNSQDQAGKPVLYKVDTLLNPDGSKSLNVYTETKSASGAVSDTFLVSLPAKPYDAGVVAMANSGPNTNGSQFFFNFADSSAGLQSNYTIWGKVTKGLDIVQYVAAQGIGADGVAPKQELAILKTYIS
jgi:peptidyl-prolyl cis-trans isomerase B (cyclophilin B)